MNKDQKEVWKRLKNGIQPGNIIGVCQPIGMPVSKAYIDAQVRKIKKAMGIANSEKL